MAPHSEQTLVAIFCALSALAVGVNGYMMPMASDPTNVRNQWDLPGFFGTVTIPGASISADNSRRFGYYHDDKEDKPDVFYSPLEPVDPYSQDFSEEHGNTGYVPFWNSRARTGSLLPLASFAPSPLSTGRVWNSNNMGKSINSLSKVLSGQSKGKSFARAPALSMANYMQNSGSNRNNYNNNNNNNNRDYNDENRYDRDDYRDDYDYDDRNDRGNRRSYDDRNDRGSRRSYNSDTGYGGRRDGQPRGTNRFNTVGSVGNVNGSNVSRGGRSMQFQNRRDSNIAGRSGRMLDDSYNQFAPDSTSRFQSRSPNDNYSRGGYRQDDRTGHWTDPNSNYNINESRRNNNYSSDNRYSSSRSSSSSFTPVPPGDYVTAPDVRSPYERGRVGAGGNVPYDRDYYNNNNYESRNYYDNYDSYEDNDFYSRNGNIMDNRRGSRGDRRSPGMNDNYYDIDYRNSNRRMDRGGGLMRYRPNNQRPDGGYYGSRYEYEVGGYDDYYDSSGSFYNHEGKRVRRFDPYGDRYEGYYNPDHLSNDSTDPDRMLQNQRRRDGRDVQNGAHLRRYDPEWDGGAGLYDEASLYRSDTKGTRSYTNGYGNDMDNRINGQRRRRGNSEDPSILSGGWGETGGRRNNRYPMSSSNRFGDYQEGEYIEDGYDRGQSRFNRQGDRYRRSGSYDDYDDYEVNGQRGGTRRGLGRRDMDGEREYYRSGDYRGPNIRGDDSMERFRQGKDVRKTDLYGFETGNTPSSKKRISRRKGSRVNGSSNRRDDMMDGRRGSTVNGSYNAPRSSSRDRRRDGGGRINGSAGRDRGLSLDDLNEML